MTSVGDGQRELEGRVSVAHRAWPLCRYKWAEEPCQLGKAVPPPELCRVSALICLETLLFPGVPVAKAAAAKPCNNSSSRPLLSYSMKKVW